MENQVKTNTDQKEQQLKKLSKMSLIRSLLPIAGLVIIFLLFNFLTNFRMIGNLPLVLSQVYVTMIAATGVFFIMTMGGLDFSQCSILVIASIVVCMLSKTSIPLAIVGGIVAGAAIGAINGYFYVYRKISIDSLLPLYIKRPPAPGSSLIYSIAPDLLLRGRSGA